ncbi:MAG: hypothetical protein R3D57_20105 [Hyphomicrobiaceae bacterium]
MVIPLLLGGCGTAPSTDLSEVSSILEPGSPEVPGSPVGAYTRIARGLKGCWLAPTAPLGYAKAYVFAAEAEPADRGGKAFIVIYERTPVGERGLKAFAVALEPDGENSKLGVENFRIAEPFGRQMLADVRRWAGGEAGCTPMAPDFSPVDEEMAPKPASPPKSTPT